MLLESLCWWPTPTLQRVNPSPASSTGDGQRAPTRPPPPHSPEGPFPRACCGLPAGPFGHPDRGIRTPGTAPTTGSALLSLNFPPASTEEGGSRPRRSFLSRSTECKTTPRVGDPLSLPLPPLLHRHFRQQAHR